MIQTFAPHRRLPGSRGVNREMESMDRSIAIREKARRYESERVGAASLRKRSQVVSQNSRGRGAEEETIVLNLSP